MIGSNLDVKASLSSKRLNYYFLNINIDFISGQSKLLLVANDAQVLRIYCQISRLANMKSIKK